MDLEALPRDWDVVVVGAGVAGAVSAYRLARRGLRVLLIDKSRWPRDKACGGCVNAAALRALSEAGLGDVGEAGAIYSRMRLASGRRQAVLPLPTGRAISRRRLDWMLARRAADAGARFLPATHAALGATKANSRDVTLRHGPQCVTVTTKLVLGCDGLQSRLLREETSAKLEVDAGSHIGVGATVAAPPLYRPGAIHMACGSHGYVGLVRAEDDRLTVGAALDPAWVKHCGGPGVAVPEVLHAAGFPVFEALLQARWHGTPRLTRRRHRLGGERVLVLGDAAGYVEPFTGGGMAWALAGAAAIEPLALAAVECWRNDLVDRWTARHTRLIRTRQRGCRGISILLRRPLLVAALLPLIDIAPVAVAPLTAWLNREYAPKSGEDKWRLPPRNSTASARRRRPGQ